MTGQFDRRKEHPSHRRVWSPLERGYRLTGRSHPILTTLLTTLGILILGYGAVAVATTVESIFDRDSEYYGSGWSCQNEVTWSIDNRGLTNEKASVADLDSAFATWTQATGIKFKYVGPIPVMYDDSNTYISSDAAVDRHIFIMFIPESQSTFLTREVVGFGSPTSIMMQGNIIASGEVGLSTDYVNRAKRAERLNLFTHEIGHALGLSNSNDPNNIMYKMVTDNMMLGAGDIKGVGQLLKECS